MRLVHWGKTAQLLLQISMPSTSCSIHISQPCQTVAFSGAHGAAAVNAGATARAPAGTPTGHQASTHARKHMACIALHRQGRLVSQTTYDNQAASDQCCAHKGASCRKDSTARWWRAPAGCRHASLLCTRACGENSCVCSSAALPANNTLIAPQTVPHVRTQAATLPCANARVCNHARDTLPLQAGNALRICANNPQALGTLAGLPAPNKMQRNRSACAERYPKSPVT